MQKAVERNRASLHFRYGKRKCTCWGLPPIPPDNGLFVGMYIGFFGDCTVYEVTLALLPKQFIKIALIIPQPLGFVILRSITINIFRWVQGGTGLLGVFLAFISRDTRELLADEKTASLVL